MYQPMLSPSPANADHAKQQAFTFNISSPTEKHSPSSSPSNTPKQSRSTSRVRVCGDDTIQPITNNFLSEPMTRVRNHTVAVDANETQLKIPHSQSKRGSISLVDHDLSQSAIHSRKMCIRLPSNHIVMCDVQIAKKRFTTHVTWVLTGEIQHVIHLSHGTLFGTRKIYLDERSIHESRKLVDDGSSHSIIVDNEQHKLLVKIHCTHGHFEYILLVNGKPLVPASEAASIGVEVPMSP